MSTGISVRNGISSALGQARQNVKGNRLNFNLMEPVVHVQCRLGEGVAVTALAEGDWVSIEDDRCYPLSADKPFGGIFHTMSQGPLRITVDCILRGAVHVKLEGLSVEHRRGTVVCADLTGSRPKLNVLGNGVKVGVLYAIENLELCRGIVLFKKDGDPRPFAGIYEARSEGRMEIVPSTGR